MAEWTEWHERHRDKIEFVPGIDCWIWVAGRSKRGTHGRVSFAWRGVKKAEYAHRAAFISQNGFTPERGKMVCHKCGVGLCVRPSHLYMGTAADNGRDTSVMGTNRSLLTFDQAYEIRCLYAAGAPLQEIAEKFNIAFGTVYPIVIGKSYKHAPFPDNFVVGRRFRKPLTKDEVSDIRNMLADGRRQSEIAKKYSVAQSVISRIKTGHKHKTT